MSDSPKFTPPDGDNDETKIRRLEDWAVRHDEWSRQGESQLDVIMDAIIKRLDVVERDLKDLLLSMATLKARLGIILVIAGAVGGVAGTVIATLIAKSLGK